MDINSLRKSRNTNFTEILAKFEDKPATRTYEKDPRFWSLEQDKVGNGSAVIRFLPNIEGDEYSAPWITTYSFGFQGPTGKWYIESSLKTIGKPDPVLELVNSLWASKIPSNIEIAKSRRQRTQYTSNVLIISDPKHPENEGKILMFKYGKSIFDKLIGLMKPTFEDQEPVNPFDLWEGANFKFRMCKKDNFANYDSSTFSDPVAVGSDDEIVAIMKERHNLQEFLMPDKFKSYEELQKKLNAVLSNDSFSNVTAEELSFEDDVPSFSSAQKSNSKAAPAIKSVTVEEDDALDYFKKLSQED